METRISCDELVHGPMKQKIEWVKERIGHEFKNKYSLRYLHGRIVKGKVKSVEFYSNDWYDVLWEATFTDGYKADYYAGIDGFIRDHFYEF